MAFYVAIAGMVLSSIAQVKQGQIQQANANANARVLANDAGITQVRAEEEAKIFAERQKREDARARARIAAGGIAIHTGSPLLALEESISNATRDMLAIQRRGVTESDRLLSQANQQVRQGKSAAQAGWINAVSSVATEGIWSRMPAASSVFASSVSSGPNLGAGNPGR